MKFPPIDRWDYVVYDTETTGLLWWRDKVFGIAVCSPEGEAFYWDVRQTPQAVAWLRSEMPRVRLLVAHNAKFDWHMGREAGIVFPEKRVVCTMTRAALIDEHLPTYDLDFLGKKYCGVGKDTGLYQELADLFGGPPTKDKQAPNMHRAPAALIGRYAKQDVTTTNSLHRFQCAEIDKQSLHQVDELERRVTPAIVRMELNGVRVNLDKAEKSIPWMTDEITRSQKQLNEMAGFEVNPNPSGSIHKLFAPKNEAAPGDRPRWVLNDGTIAETTPAGKASINSDVLREMKHPAAGLILKTRKLLKARDTFVKGHILGHHHNGVIHANFNQTKTENDVGTGTGRFSVSGPALQQIQKRDVDIASIIRAMFEPLVPGHEWLTNDWAQMDFRVFAHYLKDPRILEMYKNDPNTDFHKIASDLTGLPRKPRWAGDPNAKQINLGLIFGMGQGKLAAEMGLPYTWDQQCDADGKVIKEWMKPGPEAEAVFNKYHNAIPGVRSLLKNASSVARSRGHVNTIMGRRIRFPRGMFTHKAGGLIFQGSAADAMKVKLVEVDDYIVSLGAAGIPSPDVILMLTVHDELGNSVAPHREDIKTEISRIYTKFDGVDTPINFRVPICTGVGSGPNWWEASKE